MSFHSHFVHRSLSTKVGSQCIPADRDGSLFLFTLGHHDVVGIVAERLSFSSRRCATFGLFQIAVESKVLSAVFLCRHQS